MPVEWIHEWSYCPSLQTSLLPHLIQVEKYMYLQKSWLELGVCIICLLNKSHLLMSGVNVWGYNVQVCVCMFEGKMVVEMGLGWRIMLAPKNRERQWRKKARVWVLARFCFASIGRWLTVSAPSWLIWVSWNQAPCLNAYHHIGQMVDVSKVQDGWSKRMPWDGRWLGSGRVRKKKEEGNLTFIHSCHLHFTFS